MEILIAFVPSFFIGAAIVFFYMESRARVDAARERGEELLKAFEYGIKVGRSKERADLCMERYELEFQYRATFDIDEYLDALNWRWIDG